MTTYWVSSVNGSNANDGQSKANAKKYLELDDGNSALFNDGTNYTAAADNVILIDSAHSEQHSSALTITPGTSTPGHPAHIVSIDWSASSDPSPIVYERGAAFSTTSGSITLTSDVLYEGIDFAPVSGADVNPDGGTFEPLRMKDCTVTARQTDFYYGSSEFYAEDTAFVYSDSSAGSFSRCRYNNRFRNCTFQNDNHTATHVFIDLYNNNRYRLVFECCDFDVGSPAYGYLVNTASESSGMGLILFYRCRFPSGVALVNDTTFNDAMYGMRIIAHECFNGTAATPQNHRYEEYNFWGTILSTSSTYRRGGQGDGQTHYSLRITPTNAVYTDPMTLYRPLARWIPPGSQAITIYLSCNTTLDSSKFWIDVTSGSESSPANAIGAVNTTRSDPREAGTTLTTDSGSAWTNGGTNVYKITQAITPSEAGLVEVQLNAVDVDDDIYVDPLIGVA